MSQNPIVSQLFNLLEAYGVERVICSPGSRNAVLLEEAHRRKRLRKLVVVDERSAAFMALGLSLVSRKPVAMLCTSGSALLNYAPALAEALYQGVPLIAVSADRPLEWIEQDDSQTIRQPNAVANVVKASFSLDTRTVREDYLWYANRMINEGLSKALAPKAGPIHFNLHIHIGDPATENALQDTFKSSFISRKVDILSPPSRLGNGAIAELADYAKDKKIMIVAGFMPADNQLQKAITLLRSLPNICIMAETVSNLHLPQNDFKVDSVLFPLVPEQEAELAPDLIISLGGALISRKLKEFCRRPQPSQHWAVGFSDNIVDCFKSLSLKIECSPGPFIQTLAKLMRRMQKEMGAGLVPEYSSLWEELRNKKGLPPKDLEWCDLKALSTVFTHLPQEINLFLSNGTSVRYGQIIPYKITHATFANRGVSGIEGNTSSAIGGMLAYGGMTCLVTGDMSFRYDFGALISEIADGRMKIVVLDNGGGEIFRFINATKDLDIREKYLCADIDLPMDAFAESLGWNYFYASSYRELKSAVKAFFSPQKKPAILHLDTSSCVSNSEILRKYLYNGI